MNREEKLKLILEDERNRLLQEQNRQLKMRNILDGPSVARQTVEDDFQTGTVGVGETEEIFKLTIPSDKALVITYIGNDWYPEITYEFAIDDSRPLGPVEREIAPTENPTQVHFLVREFVSWEARSDDSLDIAEERDLGVVTGGKYVPVSIYDEYTRMFSEQGLQIDAPGFLVGNYE